MTAIDLKSLKRFIKKKEYCQKCGAELIKKLYGVFTSYNSETGKPEEWGRASVKCPNRIFLNLTLHTEYNEDGDISFD